MNTRRFLRILDLSMLTVQAWFGLLIFDLMIQLGFARVHDRLRRCRCRTNPARSTGRLEADDVVWAVEEACVWYVKRAACLQRSVVTTWLLRWHGQPAEMVIGFRPLPFESHAWVELAGRVVNDLQQYPRVFTVLERL
jgi:hypothetical protein